MEASQSRTQTVNIGLQLFPPPPKAAKKGKKRTQSPFPPSPPANRAQTPQSRSHSALSGRVGGRDSPIPHDSPHSQHFLLGESNRSRSNSGSSQGSPRLKSEPVVHSIFPRYNPDIALEHQAYYPTEGSPKHIPDVSSRKEYSPSVVENRSPSGLQSPMARGAAPGRFPRGVLDESILEPSSHDELRALWKVTNGWKVSPSEGRRFCLKMHTNPEEPIHTLSSATQAFYTLRLDPTSTSAQVTLTRQDPAKPPPKGTIDTPNGCTRPNTGIEVLGTTLEEEARRLPPNDGLVALLLPIAASRMVVDMAQRTYVACDEGSILAAAERECGRLIWDHDSKKYYLVHPCMATPFEITINHSPAWSRIEYTLEHPELPRNMVRLTRDGTGTGYLEFDTAVAAKVDCFFIADVAICAVLLVAIEEEKTKNFERFDAPPTPPPVALKREKDRKKEKLAKVEEMSIDLEAQSPMKPEATKEKDKVPGCCGLLWMLVKCGVWTLTQLMKAAGKVVIGLGRCVTGRKK